MHKVVDENGKRVASFINLDAAKHLVWLRDTINECRRVRGCAEFKPRLIVQ